MQDQIHSFTITAIIQETPGVFTFHLQEISGKKIDYNAGQFLTFLFTIDEKEVRRSYSISSAPGSREGLSITLQRIPNGLVSRHLVEHCKVGDILKAIPPSGKFILPKKRCGQYCFIAAGTGITPIFSIITFLLQTDIKCKILLVYQNRNEESSIFRKQLLQLLEGYPERMQMIELFSQPTNHSIRPARLNNTMLETIIRQNIKDVDTLFYLCGPRNFMMIAEITLKWMGYANRVKKEIFVIDAPPPPPLLQDHSTKQVEFFLAGKKHSFIVQYPQNILSAAISNGIPLPYSCRGGQCSTCMVKCVSGKVLMSKNEVLTDEDLEQGWILTCVGYAETDLVLEKEDD